MGVDILDGDIRGFVEYIPHPMFSSSSAEETLFGPHAPQIEIPHSYNFPEVPEEVAPCRPRRARLTGEEERTLFLRFNYARCRLSRLRTGMRGLFSPMRRREIRLWYGRAVQARNNLVRANVGLVVTIAKRTRIPGVEFTELISEGNLALLRSVAKFDVSRGFKLSTYAYRVILTSFHHLAAEAGRRPHQVQAPFGLDAERSDYDIKRHEIQHADSLDALREVLSGNRAHLTSVESAVLSERFAMNSSGKGRTFSQIGKRVGLSNERVRQIQILAMRKLREVLDRDYLAA